MLEIRNPATGHILETLQEDTLQSISDKFRRAQNAQKTWSSTPLSRRIEIISKFKNLIQENLEKLAKTLTSEVGKPISQSRNELNGLLPRIDFFLNQTEKVLQDERVFNDPSQKMQEVITHEPLGVIVNISAWNYPYFVGSNVFVPALLAGNAVLYKPSEFASLTGIAITKLLHQAGVPEDVFLLVLGSGSIGAELLRQPINGVFFTGSYATGKKIAESVSSNLIKVQLELGGKDPSYIAEDADPVAAAESTADGAFYNTGQSCCSVERIYVHEKVYTPFVKAFVKTVKGFKVGAPDQDDTYIGAITRAPHLEFLERQVADAKSKGAELLCGGHRIEGVGSYFEPTVLVNVNHTMELMREETFGPLIGIQRVANDDEALKLMNDTVYGLTAGIYSRSEERARKFLSHINAGSVYWNCCDRVSPRLPWSGRGRSGIGLTLSTQGILAFTQPKGWHLRGL